jgi:hypothetical protein
MTYREAVGEAPRSSPWFSSGEDFGPFEEDEREVTRLASETHATERIKELEHQVQTLQAELANQPGSGGGARRYDRGSWGLVEIITAESTGVRVCVFRDKDGTYSFDLHRHEVTSRSQEQWVSTGAVGMNNYRHGVADFGEAMTRAGNALAYLVEYENTVEIAGGQRVGVGAAVWVRVFGRDLMQGTVFSFDEANVTVDVRGMGGVVKAHGDVYASEEAAREGAREER